MKLNDYIDCLERLKVILMLDASVNNDLVDFFRDRNLLVPDAVFNLIAHTDFINKNYSYLFLGYRALGASDIIDSFNRKDEKIGFYGGYEYINNFHLTENMEIFLEDSLECEVDNSTVIKSLEKIYPLFEFQGDFIVIDLGDSNSEALLTIVDGHIGSYLAPSIIEHITDLIDGLKDGIYKITEDEIIYPSSWYLRKRKLSGQAR